MKMCVFLYSTAGHAHLSLSSLDLPPFSLCVVSHTCLPTGGKAYGRLKSEQERQLDEINQVRKVSVWHIVCLGSVNNFFVHGSYPSYLVHFCDQWYIIHMYIQLFLHVLTIASGYQMCIVVGGWMTHGQRYRIANHPLLLYCIVGWVSVWEGGNPYIFLWLIKHVHVWLALSDR